MVLQPGVLLVHRFPSWIFCTHKLVMYPWTVMSQNFSIVAFCVTFLWYKWQLVLGVFWAVRFLSSLFGRSLVFIVFGLSFFVFFSWQWRSTFYCNFFNRFCWHSTNFSSKTMFLTWLNWTKLWQHMCTNFVSTKIFLTWLNWTTYCG